jgi:hypothetical protein
MLQELEKIFTEKLQEKTGWGRNEIISLFKSSLIETAENNPQTSQNVSNVLTKKEQFIISILNGYCANDKMGNDYDEQIVRMAIQLADELLKQLNNGK